MTLLLEGMGALAYDSGELYMMAIHIMGCALICTVVNYNEARLGAIQGAN